VNLRIVGGIEAPIYVHGVTPVAEWNNEIRFRPAPWAEFVSEKVIITAPSVLAREISNPHELMDLWDKILDEFADLLSIPRERDRPERIVADVQISAGHMHSGYPIMTHLDVAETSISYAKLMVNGSWGHFHEGHNHQDPMWTFSGTGEVTCNIFSMYIYNQVLGIPTHRAHPDMYPEKMETNILEYIKEGVPFDTWKSSPFLALLTYYQLEREFGWEMYKNVFSHYNELTVDENPANDQEKIDLWCGLVSRVTGQNMDTFFKSWGFPITQCDPKLPEILPPTELKITDLFDVIDNLIS